MPPILSPTAAGGGGASQADIDAAIAALVDSSPAALDTLNELAAALGDDANFATTVTNELAAKVAKSTLDANSILYATTDDTPAALAVAASRIVGRKATGDVGALTAAEIVAILQATLDASFAPAANNRLVDSDRIVRTSGSLTLSNNSNVFGEVSSALRITLQGAQVGDIVKVGLPGMMSGGVAAENALNCATIVSGAIVNQFVTGTRTPSLGYATGTPITPTGGPCEYVVQAGDIIAGSPDTVVVSPIHSSGAAGTLYATSAYGLQFWAELWRPPS